MTSGLPPGLISIQDQTTTETEDEHQQGIDVDTVGRTWKIYVASSRVLGEHGGQRLQNIFWRTWSNPYLLQTLDNDAFTQIVNYVGAGHGRLELPRRSPRPARERVQGFGQQDETTRVPSGPPTATASPVQANAPAAGSSPRPVHVREPSVPSARSPQSILKKPSVNPDSDQGVTVQNQSRAMSSSHQEATDSSSSNTGTLSPTSLDRPRLNRNSSGTNKRASFVATNAAKSKTRPSLARRKSSQGTVPPPKEQQRSPRIPLKPSVGNQPHPTLPSTGEGRMGIAPPPGLLGTKASPVFLLPSASSWQSVDSGDHSHLGSGQEDVVQGSDPLVDRDFRRQFVEYQRTASSLNVAGAARKMRKTGSVVRFADELPTTFGKGKAREQAYSGETTQPLRRNSGPDLPEQPAASSTTAVTDYEDEDDDDPAVTLPTRKSQLSLMIAGQRRMSGSHNLDSINAPDDSQQEGNAKKHEKGGEKEDTEDELLTMGRRDGVTRAGGVVRSARVPLRTNPPTSEQRYRSPTPPPLY